MWQSSTLLRLCEFLVVRVRAAKKGLAGKPGQPVETYPVTELAQLLRRARRRVRPSEPSPPNPSSDQVAGSGTAETVMVKVAGDMWKIVVPSLISENLGLAPPVLAV